MIRTIEGIYRAGRVELLEKPDDVEGARVFVVFVPETNGSRHVTSASDATERAIARMKTGYQLGGPPYPKRGELYDRFESERP